MPKNIYTELRKGIGKGPHRDTGNNNLYVAMGLKPKRVKSGTCPSTSNKK